MIIYFNVASIHSAMILHRIRMIAWYQNQSSIFQRTMDDRLRCKYISSSVIWYDRMCCHYQWLYVYWLQSCRHHLPTNSEFFRVAKDRRVDHPFLKFGELISCISNQWNISLYHHLLNNCVFKMIWLIGNFYKKFK